MKQGDLVVRKSYGGDIVFCIERIEDHIAYLRGVEFRLLADAPVSDLEIIPVSSAEALTRHYARMANESLHRILDADMSSGVARYPQQSPGASTIHFEMPGKVLHLDGDPNYFHKCMGLYREFKVPAEGIHVKEEYMADALTHLLPRVRPDIVVVTGHDGVLKQGEQSPDLANLSSYKHSHYFIQAVNAAREYDSYKDALVVIAGACQSHFEGLMSAGANFASSPARVLIHALDPLYIAVKVAYTPIRETVDIQSIISQTFSGLEGLGGLDTKGAYRSGMPHGSHFQKRDWYVLEEEWS